MSNLSKGTGSRKDTKMRIRAFPVSRSSAPGTRSRGREPHARPGLNSANRPQPASPPPRPPPVAGREASRQRGGAGPVRPPPGPFPAPRPPRGLLRARPRCRGPEGDARCRRRTPRVGRVCNFLSVRFPEGPGLVGFDGGGQDCPPLLDSLVRSGLAIRLPHSLAEMLRNAPWQNTTSSEHSIYSIFDPASLLST